VEFSVFLVLKKKVAEHSHPIGNGDSCGFSDFFRFFWIFSEYYQKFTEFWIIENEDFEDFLDFLRILPKIYGILDENEFFEKDF
jgi:hypothetical protein